MHILQVRHRRFRQVRHLRFRQVRHLQFRQVWHVQFLQVWHVQFLQVWHVQFPVPYEFSNEWVGVVRISRRRGKESVYSYLKLFYLKEYRGFKLCFYHPRLREFLFNRDRRGNQLLHIALLVPFAIIATFAASHGLRQLPGLWSIL